MTPTPTESRLVAALHNARCAGGGRCDPRGGVAGCAISSPPQGRRRRTGDNAAPYGLFIEDDVLLQPGAGRAVAQALDEVAARQPGWAALWFTYAARDVGATRSPRRRRAGPTAHAVAARRRRARRAGARRDRRAALQHARRQRRRVLPRARGGRPRRRRRRRRPALRRRPPRRAVAGTSRGTRSTHALAPRPRARAPRRRARGALRGRRRWPLLDACAGDCWLWSANDARPPEAGGGALGAERPPRGGVGARADRIVAHVTRRRTKAI